MLQSLQAMEESQFSIAEATALNIVHTLRLRLPLQYPVYLMLKLIHDEIDGEE
jgi:hypothetical protein